MSSLATPLPTPAEPVASPVVAPADGPAPAPLTLTQTAALDDPSTWASHTHWIDAPAAPGGEAAQGGDGARRASSRLLISGIHCAACAGLIEDALMRRPGVLRAEVSGAAERAVVEWQPDRVRLSELVETVRAAGYGAYPDHGAQALDAARRDTRDALWRFFVAGFCMMQVMMYATPSYVSALADIGDDLARLLRWASWLLSVPVMLFSIQPFLKGAWRALRERRIGMDVPVALGLIVTFVASSAAAFSGAADSEVYFDSLTMFVTFLLGARWLEGVARRRAARSLDALMRRLPDAVERLDAADRATLVSAQALAVGDRVRVQVGQAFAADGVLLAGETTVDEAMLTGESLPVPKAAGAAVLAGCLNLGAPVVMRVEALGTATRYHRIVELVERALTQRPRALLAADRWAGPFLWIVLALAVAAYGVWHWIDPARALWVAVSVLIVTCPCALSIGAPVAYLAAAGRLARDGVLVQRLDALEGLSEAADVVFDKTGTLTEDSLGLAQVSLADATLVPGWSKVWAASPSASASAPDEVTVLRLAAALAAHSAHPLSRALVRAGDARGAAPATPLPVWLDVQERPGQGLAGATLRPLGGLQDWRLGSEAWALGLEASVPGAPARAAAIASGTGPVVVLGMRIAEDSAAWREVARFQFDEQLRADAAQALGMLGRAGVRTHLLSGDRAAGVEALAARLGMSTWRAACAPEDKLQALESLQQGDRPVVMVGDGINDAPVLARADVSVAMGSAATLAQARADVVILANRLMDVVHLRRVAQRTMAIVRQNLRWALFYNLACVPLALVGWLPPWAAGLGMAASSLLVVLNALRLARA